MTTLRAAQTGQLLTILTTALPGWKRATLKQYLRNKCISVNGLTVVRHDSPIDAGDEIHIQTGTHNRSSRVPDHGIRILFEDDALIAVDKPCAVLSVPSPPHRAPAVQTELDRYFIARGDRSLRAHRVHRLDKPASGILLFAKSSVVRARLIKDWGDFEKSYLAIVEGRPLASTGTLEQHLLEGRDMRVRVDENAARAKLAVTRYQVLASHRRHSLVQCWLETGLKNQIRVQLANLGHPILGDQKYGASSNPLNRLALHAWRLQLRHPVTTRPLTIVSPYPSAFARLFPEPTAPRP